MVLSMGSQWDPKSPWSDPRVRKAASLAIDRQTLADIHHPGTRPIGSIGLEGDPLAVEFPPDPYDPERAKRLLSEAGYPKGFHGGKFYYFQEFSGTGELVATFWKAIGIDLDMNPLERSAWYAQHNTGKMKGAVFLDILGAPSVSARLNYLFGPQNYGNYPDIEALWEQYNQTFDPKVRKELISNIQRLIYDRTLIVHLVRASVPSAIGPRVKGDPFKFRQGFPLWFPSPMEDLELNE